MVRYNEVIFQTQLENCFVILCCGRICRIKDQSVQQSVTKLRVDKFIFHHIEYLDGKLNLTSGEANQEAIMNENISSKIFSLVKRQHEDVDEINIEMDKTEQDSLNETENWRCRIKAETSANNRVSKPKSNYLTPCTDWETNSLKQIKL